MNFVQHFRFIFTQPVAFYMWLDLFPSSSGFKLCFLRMLSIVAGKLEFSPSLQIFCTTVHILYFLAGMDGDTKLGRNWPAVMLFQTMVSSFWHQHSLTNMWLKKLAFEHVQRSEFHSSRILASKKCLIFLVVMQSFKVRSLISRKAFWPAHLRFFKVILH